MGCGIGACLVCACAVKDNKSGSIIMSRACVDGPVFCANDVAWMDDYE